jgi:hypothetical protein
MGLKIIVKYLVITLWTIASFIKIGTRIAIFF